ncbi:MAG TPA: LemA family protein [Flavipsychrobacter sp.]|jgi:LemA protein|nr:LemA family protein [Flavipsychrobacter sp.]
MKSSSIILLAVLALLLIGGCMTCNVQKSLVTLDENAKSKWGEVQNQYQRRADLVPNLVSTVKGAANFEQKTLTDVIEARAKATSIQVNPENLTPEKLQEFQAAQGQLSQALGRLMMVTENYPQLRATEAFRDLQVQLEGTENRITVARKSFNDAVQQYNTQLRIFPNNIFAGMMGFAQKGMFEADQNAQKAPQVQF